MYITLLNSQRAVKQKYININIDDKAEFSASLLQSSVLHDPSEIKLICWFIAEETVLVINVENSFFIHLYIWIKSI